MQDSLLPRDLHTSWSAKGLGEVLGNSLRAIRHLQRGSGVLVTMEPVCSVLPQIAYDPEDHVLVLSRSDRAQNFWSDDSHHQYLSFLRKATKGSHLNQTRVVTYIPDAEDPRVEDEEAHYIAELRNLHEKDTLYSVPSDILSRFGVLQALVFGFTLSTLHDYVILPIPANIAHDLLAREAFVTADAINQCRDYQGTSNEGSLVAAVSVDTSVVENVRHEMEQLLAYIRSEVKQHGEKGPCAALP